MKTGCYYFPNCYSEEWTASGKRKKEKAEQAWSWLQIRIFSDQANAGSEASPGQKGVSSPILDPREDLNPV